MTPFVETVLLAFAALLPIVNPLGMAPIFAEMTMPFAVAMRRKVALRVAINGVVLLVASLFVGSYVLDFFGISLAAVQLGGGLIVTTMGWQILNRKRDESIRRAEAQPSDQEILAQAFYPLTMPMTVCPGSIAVAVTLGSNLHEEPLHLIPSMLASVIGIVLVGISIYLCYAYADQLERLLGNTGISIVIRLSAFILVCIGIEIMVNGLEDIYVRLVKAAAGVHAP